MSALSKAMKTASNFLLALGIGSCAGTNNPQGRDIEKLVQEELSNFGPWIQHVVQTDYTMPGDETKVQIALLPESELGSDSAYNPTTNTIIISSEKGVKSLSHELGHYFLDDDDNPGLIKSSDYSGPGIEEINEAVKARTEMPSMKKLYSLTEAILEEKDKLSDSRSNIELMKEYLDMQKCDEVRYMKKSCQEVLVHSLMKDGPKTVLVSLDMSAARLESRLEEIKSFNNHAEKAVEDIEKELNQLWKNRPYKLTKEPPKTKNGSSLGRIWSNVRTLDKIYGEDEVFPRMVESKMSGYAGEDTPNLYNLTEKEHQLLGRMMYNRQPIFPAGISQGDASKIHIELMGKLPRISSRN